MVLRLDSDATAGQGFEFIGRHHELDLVLRAVARPPAVVLVEGEAGVGKSRLVREAATSIQARGGRTLTGSCHPLREPLPFGPVIEALRDAVGWLPSHSGIDPVAGALAPLLPAMAARLPMPPPSLQDPRAERHQLIQGVRALLDALSPVVLIVEDLHWVDAATRELLLLLARDLPPGLALVLTYRQEDLPSGMPVLGTAYRRPPGTSGAEIRLEPLTEPEVLELASGVLGSQATAKLSRVLFERSAGLPLIAEEDLITLVEQGRRIEGAGVEQAIAELERTHVPRELREALTARMAGLPPDAVAMVEAAAVLAVPSGEQLITRVARLDPDRAAQGLIDALTAAVLRESGPGQYGFRHVLAQQVIYHEILGPKRRLLHARAIEELGRQAPQSLVQIAHHCRALGDRQAWLQQAEAAAGQAIALGDDGTAAGMLHEILAEPQLDPELRTRSALALSRITLHRVDYSATVPALRQIVADRRLPVTVRGEIRLTLGLMMVNQGGDAYGFGEIERAVGELTERPDLAARAMTALVRLDQPTEVSLDWLERAERTIADWPDEAAIAPIRATKVALLGLLDDPQIWDHIKALPREHADVKVLRQTARALANLTGNAIVFGYDHRAIALIGDLRDLCARTGTQTYDCMGQVYQLTLCWHGGDWAGLQDRLTALGTQYPDMNKVNAAIRLLSGNLFAAQGEWRHAAELFGQVIAETDNTEPFLGANATAGLARVRLAQGDPRAAWDLVRPAVAALHTTGLWLQSAGLLPVAVEAALACADQAAAAQLTERYEAELDGKRVPAHRAELALCHGLLAQATGNTGPAAEAFTRAAGLFREIGRPYPAALAAERAARIGGSPDAAQELAQIGETLAGLGATSDASRCQQALRELGQARPSSPRGRRGYGDALSPREQEIATLIASGASNKDIAQALFLSQRTVEHHVARTLKKLGVPGREAVRDALALRKNN